MQNKSMYFSSRNAEILWLKGNERIDYSNRNYNISLPYRLAVKQISADDEGWYTCNVSNNFTTVSQKAFLNVKGKIQKPFIFFYPLSCTHKSCSRSDP